MYIPEPFAVTDAAEIERLLTAHPFACLVTHDDGELYATHLPLLYDSQRQVLAGHMAKPNPHAGAAPGGKGLAIFSGPNAYISPNWYPAKAEHGRVVPTWNYEAVHVHGTVRWREDAAWLHPHLTALVERFEEAMTPPWALADAPGDYVDKLMRGIVGVELSIERIDAKRKLSQHRPAAEQQSVIAALSQSADPRDRAVAQAMQRG
jgi:transcriptional regulator